MLPLELAPYEEYDEDNNKFIYHDENCKIKLEHSLISIHDWEKKYHKPFLKDNEEKTYEEMLFYIKCMNVSSKEYPDSVYERILKEKRKEIDEYLNDPMTATTFSKKDQKNGIKDNNVLTAEVIYYYMISYNIPIECQKWHLSSLLTLIKVCGIKNEEAEKNKDAKGAKSQITASAAARRRELNAKRRAAIGSKG